MPTLVAIYATSTGHTEFVIDAACAALAQKIPELKIEKVRAERSDQKDFERADVLVLGSGTWNTNSVEGQLNPHMYALLNERIAGIDLKTKPVALVALGDERYHYTARSAEHLQVFLRNHNGKLLLPPLVIVNEPYEQNERIERWAEKLAASIKSLKEWAGMLAGK